MHAQALRGHRLLIPLGLELQEVVNYITWELELKLGFVEEQQTFLSIKSFLWLSVITILYLIADCHHTFKNDSPLAYCINYISAGKSLHLKVDMRKHDEPCV